MAALSPLRPSESVIFSLPLSLSDLVVAAVGSCVESWAGGGRAPQDFQGVWEGPGGRVGGGPELSIPRQLIAGVGASGGVGGPVQTGDMGNRLDRAHG